MQKASAADKTSLEQIAHELFEQMWRDAAMGNMPDTQPGDEAGHDGRLRWLLPEMIRLMTACSHQSVQELEPSIRRLIAEHAFIDETGDAVVDPCHADDAERYSQVFMRVLTQLRPRALRGGHWSHMPVTPQMFG